MPFNDDEEALLQRMVNEDIESREMMFEVSASGNHALIREVTQYDNIFADEEEQNKEPEEVCCSNNKFKKKHKTPRSTESFF